MSDNSAGSRGGDRGGRVAANSLWSLLGQAVPMVPGVLCIPPIIRGLGVERFGILTLVWVVIGYLGLFDLGLGRSLTKLVAEKADRSSDEEISRLVWTALGLLVLLSLVGALLVASLSPWIVGKLLAISRPLQNEAVSSLRLLALGIPAVFLSGGLKGVLEARGWFGSTNLVRIPMGVYSFVGPLVALRFSNSLAVVTAVLVAGRVVTCASFFALCLVALPALRKAPALDLSVARPLVRLGGWMTVSNVVSPVMVNLDRLMIGAISPMAIVAYYTTPYEAVSKLLLIPGSLAAVLFPLFSRSYASDRQRTSQRLSNGIKYLFLCLFPPVLLVVAFAREGLTVWLGDVFAQNSTQVAQVLSVGVFFGGLAVVGLVFVQGVGRPDLTAKVHLIEMPLYLIGLRVLIPIYGVLGAAIVWFVRLAVESAVFLAICGRLLPECWPMIRRLAVATAAAAVTLGLATLPTTAATRAIFTLCVMGLFSTTAWFWALTPAERGWVRKSCTARPEWLAR